MRARFVGGFGAACALAVVGACTLLFGLGLGRFFSLCLAFFFSSSLSRAAGLAGAAAGLCWWRLGRWCGLWWCCRRRTRMLGWRRMFLSGTSAGAVVAEDLAAILVEPLPLGRGAQAEAARRMLPRENGAFS